MQQAGLRPASSLRELSATRLIEVARYARFKPLIKKFYVAARTQGSRDCKIEYRCYVVDLPTNHHPATCPFAIPRAPPSFFFAPGPTNRPSTRRNSPDPEAPFAPESCSSLEIESGASKIARRRGAGSKAAGAPRGPSRRTQPPKSSAAIGSTS